MKTLERKQERHRNDYSSQRGNDEDITDQFFLTRSLMDEVNNRTGKEDNIGELCGIIAWVERHIER